MTTSHRQEPDEDLANTNAMKIMITRPETRTEVVCYMTGAKKFNSLFKSFCKKYDMHRRDYCFIVGNSHVRGNHTPERHNMRDGDVIRVCKVDACTRPFRLILRYQNRDYAFETQRLTPFRTVMREFHKESGIHPANLCFLAGGRHIDANECPARIRIHHDRIIQVCETHKCTTKFGLNIGVYHSLGERNLRTINVEPSGKVQDIVSLYCTATDRAPSNCRFLHDARLIENGDNVHEIGIHHGDTLEVCSNIQIDTGAEPQNDYWTVYVREERVLTGDKRCVCYRLRKTTPMRQILKAILERGKIRSCLTYILRWRGRRVDLNATPQQLGIFHGEMLRLEARPRARYMQQTIIFSVRSATIDIPGLIHQDQKFKAVFGEKVGASKISDVFFTFGGRRITPEDTPDSVGMQDYDIVEIHPHITPSLTLSFNFDLEHRSRRFTMPAESNMLLREILARLCRGLEVLPWDLTFSRLNKQLPLDATPPDLNLKNGDLLELCKAKIPLNICPPPSDTGVCHFMRLPPELRCEIYKLAVTTPEHLTIRGGKCGAAPWAPPPLCRVSSEIRAESLPYFLNNTFVCRLTSLQKKLSASNLARAVSWLTQCLPLDMPNLRIKHMYFDWSELRVEPSWELFMWTCVFRIGRTRLPEGPLNFGSPTLDTKSRNAVLCKILSDMAEFGHAARCRRYKLLKSVREYMEEYWATESDTQFMERSEQGVWGNSDDSDDLWDQYTTILEDDIRLMGADDLERQNADPGDDEEDVIGWHEAAVDDELGVAQEIAAKEGTNSEKEWVSATEEIEDGS